MTQIALSATALSRSFLSGSQTVRVLSDATLSVNRGEMVAIMGRSGSGKSTLLNLLGLLLEPSGGTLYIDGINVAGTSRQRRASMRLSAVGFVFQAFQLIDHKTVSQNVELPLKLMGLPRKERKLRVAEVLDRLDVSHRSTAKPATLSGGEKQRVAIARAVVTRPTILLCDEPTGNLDSVRAAEVMSLLRDSTGSDTASIVVTHDPDVAAACARTIYITDGVTSATDSARPSAGPVGGAQARHPLRPRLFTFAIAEALQSFVARAGRNLLTALGVAIGVATLTLNVGLSSTASAQITDEFNAFLAQQVALQSDDWTGEDQTWMAERDESLDAERVRNLNGVRTAGMTAVTNGGDSVEIGTSEAQVRTAPVASTLRVMGVHGLRSLEPKLVHGRFFDQGHIDRGDDVALIGVGLFAQLGARWTPGMQLWVGDDPVLLLGVVDDEDPAGGLYNSLIAPTTLRLPSLNPSLIDVRLIIRVDAGAAGVVGEQSPVAFEPTSYESVQSVTGLDPTTLRGSIAETTTLLLFIMAGVALTIGAIGVTNTFLVAALERRREIGVRMAIGTPRRAILQQFAAEAIAVGALGGAIGLTLGIDGVTLISILSGWSPVIDPLVPALGLLSGLVLGLVAGIYPAIKASRIDPVESLAV
ncbi:ATP-binding cassette domain-containing protein [Galbitalea sp. SE-J8]|uniref:ABC transporter ATP-binding protein/permease n=1 Tax=Galbitalea sp. SE-J8 TaxID=3054952 RepID=UPI00259CECBB|nr:ABC transporter ATP-binding protein/permease [Galbitalea sp. SE-J8]MDM4764418.1 ATP-binding cassette domain-containing protein [Galbitalea sp. SE-J8]